MGAQNRSRHERADPTLEAILHRLRLAEIGHDREDLLSFQNLPHRHRKRLLRHLRKTCEPCFAYLLLSAGLVQVHHDVRIFSFKVGGWIVKCNVAVFTYSEESYIDRRCRQLFPNLPREVRWVIRVAIEQMIVDDSSFLDQLLQKHLAKTAGMSHG